MRVAPGSVGCTLRSAMRSLLAVALLALLAPSAAAQFTPPGQSADIRYWGIHFDSNALAPLDRYTSISYRADGARLVHFDSPLPTLLYGILLLATGDEGEVTRTNDRFVPLPIDAWTGATFVPTPVGEVGLGVDFGGAGMTARPSVSDLDLVLYAGPNVLFTARPVENLHLVGHAAYQLMVSLGDAENGIGNRLVEVDLQGTYPLSDRFALYGGVHVKRWTFPSGPADGAPTVDFGTNAVSIGIKLSPDYLFAF